MKKNIYFFIFSLFVISSTGLAQFDFNDDFEQYIQGVQLACQNPTDWTTWSLTPCDGIEDPIITTLQAFSGSKSVVIFQYNNLIKPLGNDSTGRDYINFQIYIPSGYSGYFSLLSEFDSAPYQKAMECYFDVGGTGRLMSVPGAPVTFNYTNSQWHYVQTVVDFDLDEAQFWIDGYLIYTWQWSQNGTIDSKLAANQFYGPYTSNKYYLDDYLLFADNCLQCIPPPVPENLTAQEILTPDPGVQLNWDYYQLANGFKIIRKSGLPGEPGTFEQIGMTLWDTTQFIDSNVVVDSTYTYGLMAFNIYGYSDTSNFASITIDPIPVELVSFTYSNMDEGIELNWITATEINNRGFEVQRSEGGDQRSEVGDQRSEVRGQRSEWEKIGFVEGNGTTTLRHQYSFTDKNLQPGKYIYRLKQIDFEGSYEYSYEIEADVRPALKYSLEQNFPNPFNSTTTVCFSLPEAAHVSFNIFNTVGQKVVEVVNATLEKGGHCYDFNAKDFASGIYILDLRTNKFAANRKMVLLK